MSNNLKALKVLEGMSLFVGKEKVYTIHAISPNEGKGITIEAIQKATVIGVGHPVFLEGVRESLEEGEDGTVWWHEESGLYVWLHYCECAGRDEYIARLLSHHWIRKQIASLEVALHKVCSGSELV